MNLVVYSRRQGHNDTYRIAKTPSGWEVHHIAIGGACDKQGQPYLFENLDHDSINYPADLGGYMEFLWNEADAKGWSDADIQPYLDIIGTWIQQVEKSSPGGLWDSFK